MDRGKFSLVSQVCLLAVFLFLLTILLVEITHTSSAQPLFTPTSPSIENRQDSAQASQFWVVRVYFSDRQMVAELAAWLEPWEVNDEEGYLVVGVTAEEYQYLEQAGFRLEIDPKLTAQFNQPRIASPEQTNGIPSYPCYRTVEETYASSQSLASAYPILVSWSDIGDSWEKTQAGGLPGYDLMVLRLTNSTMPGPKPKLFLMASMHAREYTPAELAMRFAEYLVENYNQNPDVTWLLDYQEIHFLLQANPDGRKHAENGLLWRKNTNQNYCSPTSNQRGADLNRNFSFLWGCCGGSSGSQCNETYRGPSAASEPETQAVQNYLRVQFPDQRGANLSDPAPETASGIFLDLHSYSKLVLWPWGFTPNPAPNGVALQTLGRKLAYFNGYSPIQAYGLYPTDGTTDDFAYGDLGIAAFTFELGDAFFETCNNFENIILPQNLASLLYAAKVARTPYLTPAGPDILTPTATPAGVMIGEPIQLSATLDDTRFNNSQGSEPTQPILGGRYFINIPPWDVAAVAIPLQPVDGSFDESVEDAFAALDTSSLSHGRHIIFFQAEDAAGNWGSVTALFIYAVDPSLAGTIEGYIHEVGTYAPLQANVTAGAFQTTSQLPDGYYSIQVMGGTYTVGASSFNHLTSTIEQVQISEQQVVRQDFYLTPVCQILIDDVENGPLNWNAQAPWQISEEMSHSPSHAWSDSPSGYYQNNRNISLTSTLFDLSALSGISLRFWHSYDLEASYDFGSVEYSTDGGSTWTTVQWFTGTQPGWSQETIPLPALDGQPNARIRFRLYSDGYITQDGWHIDDISLSGTGADCGSAWWPLFFPLFPNG